MAWVVSKAKDFIGKRSYTRIDTARPDRKHLVGVLPVDLRSVSRRELSWSAHGARRQRRHPAGADARPRDLELPQRRPGSLVRAGTDQERPQSHRPDSDGCGRPTIWSTSWSVRPSSTTPKGTAAMAETALTAARTESVGRSRTGQPGSTPRRPVRRGRGLRLPRRPGPRAAISDHGGPARRARGQPPRKRAQDLLGAALPARCGAVAAAGDTTVLWLLPDEFLLVSGDQPTAVTQALVQALDGGPGSATDLSANRTTFELLGPMARDGPGKGVSAGPAPTRVRAGHGIRHSARVRSRDPVEDRRRGIPGAAPILHADFLGRWLLDAHRRVHGAGDPLMTLTTEPYSMALSALDMFSVGIGPSSSHTVGPMRAAALFVDRLRRPGLLDEVVRVQAELFGSLGATGHGHGSDKAVILGFQGEPAGNRRHRHRGPAGGPCLLHRPPGPGRRPEHRLLPIRRRHPASSAKPARAPQRDDLPRLRRRWCRAPGGHLLLRRRRVRRRRARGRRRPDTSRTRHRLRYPFTTGAQLLAICRAKDCGSATS